MNFRFWPMLLKNSHGKDMPYALMRGGSQDDGAAEGQSGSTVLQLQS